MKQLPVISSSELPCFPCPHVAKCCSFGSYVTPAEADELRSRFGDSVVRLYVDDESEELRTAVVDGHCVFWMSGGGCRIHSDPAYPAVCRLFPWEDIDGGPYMGDRTICPEFHD